jgi:cobalamin biosynthesis Mg chelatase CobN
MENKGSKMSSSSSSKKSKGLSKMSKSSKESKSMKRIKSSKSKSSKSKSSSSKSKESKAMKTSKSSKSKSTKSKSSKSKSSKTKSSKKSKSHGNTTDESIEDEEDLDVNNKGHYDVEGKALPSSAVENSKQVEEGDSVATNSKGFMSAFRVETWLLAVAILLAMAIMFVPRLFTAARATRPPDYAPIPMSSGK